MNRRTRMRLLASAVVGGGTLIASSNRILEEPHVVTGTIVEFHAGDWLAIANDQFVPLPLALHDQTRYEDRNSRRLGEPSAIGPGIRASVWYRSVGERRLVVDKVRVLGDDPQ